MLIVASATFFFNSNTVNMEIKAMAKFDVSDGFSAGLGLAIGLTMGQCIHQAMKPKGKIKEVIVCLKCGFKNPIENKYCGQCGKALYPSSPIQCPRCGNFVPLNNYCGRCGHILKKRKQKRRKIKVLA